MSQFFVYLFIAARNFVKYVWPAVGPLVGVFIGAYIANQNQRKHWLADNRKEEYRELMAVITKSLNAYLERYVLNIGVVSGEDERHLQETLTEVMQITRSRLFIRDAIERLDVVNRWHSLTDTYERTREHSPFSKGMGKLLDDIAEAAAADFSR